MDEKGTVASKQQLGDQFVDGFRACEETLKVEETAVCSETDVDAVWQILFCLTEHDDKEEENNVGATTHPCLTPLEMGKLPDSDPLYLT